MQERAPGNLRRHLERAVRRIATLVLADLGTFAIMRALLRAVRDRGMLGADVAAALRAVVPPRVLNGWQFAFALLVGLVVMGTYGPGDRRRDGRRLFAAVALAAALPLWTAFWSRGPDTVLVEYVLTVGLVWAGLVAERMMVDNVVTWIHPAANGALSALFVGPGAACRAAAATPAFSAGADYRPIGFVDVHSPPAPGAVAHIVDFQLVLAASGAEVVVLCGQLTDAQFEDVVDAALAGGCQVLSVPRAAGTAGVHPTTVWRSGQPLVQLTAPGFQGQQLFVKRVLDVVVATIGLVLLSPVFATLALVVKLDSRGSVFFTQERVGRGGRRFRILKFRTMVDGADARRGELISQSLYGDERLFKVAKDPRVTKLGRWLRRTSLDELPQLVNVLRGEMSLVGPRPPLPGEVSLYEAHQFARFDVKPGMTGPWQVAGRNEITDFERVIALECEYIQNWSIGRDLWLLVKTVPAVFGRRGAH